MCGIPRNRRRTARYGFAGRFIKDTTAAASMAARQAWGAPTTTMPRRSMLIALRLPPHIVQRRIHCRQIPAGFGVSRISDQTVRSPWYLSCCQRLDQSRYHLIPFESHDGVGRRR